LVHLSLLREVELPGPPRVDERSPVGTSYERLHAVHVRRYESACESASVTRYLIFGDHRGADRCARASLPDVVLSLVLYRSRRSCCGDRHEEQV